MPGATAAPADQPPQIRACGTTASGFYCGVTTSSMSQGILILDVTSPGSVEYIGSLDVGDDVVSLAAVGTGLYAGAGDLIVIDVSSPTSPTVVSWAGTTTQSVAVHDSRL